MIVLLILISFITFVIFTTLPTADPILLHAGRNPTPERIKAITENLGLDKPWYEQYWKYANRLFLHFDFGRSRLDSLKCAL